MNLKKLMALLICMCITMTTISFVLSGSGSASDLPRDIDGNVWGVAADGGSGLVESAATGECNGV